MNAPRSSRLMLLLAASVLAAAMSCARFALGQAPDAAIPGTADGSIFINVLTQKHDLYVGESLPVVIQVGAQDEVVASLDSPPSLRGDAFTLNVLSGEPEREQRVINGKPCTVLSWHSLLAAVKPGVLSLTIEAPLTVRVPVAQQAEPNYADESTGDPYSDPAFQSLLQTTTARAIVASSPPVSFHVLALPAEDRPAGFSGAVGHFSISSELSKERTVVGEPLTLRMHVLGSGNFDRVNSSMLGTTGDWKIYRPTASFTPAESGGFRGEKLFEQAVVATRPGTHDLPALQFSYFDPETRRYEIARAAPLSVEVGAAPANSAPLSAQTAAVDSAPPVAAAHGAALVRGDHVAPAKAAESLTPLYLQPRYLSVPVLLIFAFGGVWFKRVHRNHGAAVPAANLREPSTADLLRQMQEAAESGDEALFFRSAGRALRRAGVFDHDAEVREILQLVDEANYGGELPHGADLRRCRRVVLRCIAARPA